MQRARAGRAARRPCWAGGPSRTTARLRVLLTNGSFFTIATVGVAGCALQWPKTQLLQDRVERRTPFEIVGTNQRSFFNERALKKLMLPPAACLFPRPRPRPLPSCPLSLFRLLPPQLLSPTPVDLATGLRSSVAHLPLATEHDVDAVIAVREQRVKQRAVLRRGGPRKLWAEVVHLEGAAWQQAKSDEVGIRKI